MQKQSTIKISRQKKSDIDTYSDSSKKALKSRMDMYRTKTLRQKLAVYTKIFV